MPAQSSQQPYKAEGNIITFMPVATQESGWWPGQLEVTQGCVYFKHSAPQLPLLTKHRGRGLADQHCWAQQDWFAQRPLTSVSRHVLISRAAFSAEAAECHVTL